MIFRVTKRIGKGSLSLPTIGYSVRAGATLTLKDSDYYANDIQSAIRDKYLSIEEAPVHNEQQSYVKIINVSGKRLVFDTNVLQPDDEIYLPLDEAKMNNNLQGAVRSGLVIIEDVSGQSKDTTNITKKAPKKKLTKPKAVKKIAKKKAKKKKIIKAAKKKKAVKSAKKKSKKKSVNQIEIPENANMREYVDSQRAKMEEETKTNMQSWDPHTQSPVLKEESSSRVARVASSVKNTENEDGVQVGEADFSEKPKTKLRKKGEKRTVSTKKASKKAAKKGKKSLKPVGVRREEATDIDFVDREQTFERAIQANLPAPPEPEDILFVDKEQTDERMRKAGLAPPNSEVE